MRIVTARRISQVFFLLLFAWFCVVSTPGYGFARMGDWPVNWILQLDPLVAIATVLATGRLYAGLTWGLVTIILTLLFGRFFCGWLCPLGTMQHAAGYLAHRKKKAADRLRLNRYRSAAVVKYIVLAVLLVSAAAGGGLLTGILDPIPFAARSVNLALLPIVDRPLDAAWATDRFYGGGASILCLFAGLLCLCAVVPRFYCRFVCPLGALFGVIASAAFWRIGKKKQPCSNCMACEKFCEGGCSPSGKVRNTECVLCFNCLDDCSDSDITYSAYQSAGGHVSMPDVSRRAVVMSIAGGVLVAPALSLGRRRPLVRPPGSLDEDRFLERCIRCGQCMRICPTNVLQPAGIDCGLEVFWTPVMNNRIGTSACQLNCTACGKICPTSAIRTIDIDEKLGTGPFADTGPFKIGTAFVDRSRCLPWAYDRPCIVCEENCPVSPKAIFTRRIFETTRDGALTVAGADASGITLSGGTLEKGVYGGGDHYVLFADGSRRRILSHDRERIDFGSDGQSGIIPSDGSQVYLQVLLLRPFVDRARCIGCGICEHECPVSGGSAIIVSPEGQSRESGT